GGIGEIAIGGPEVPHGYLGDAARTAERFRPSTHGVGARRYLTGDFGRWHGPRLEFFGRRDRQVKVRGHRIELAEVEAAIRATETVGDVVVDLVQVRGSARLAAFVVEQAPGATSELLGALEARLPKYMVP